MTMRKVIALCAVQRRVGDDRELIKAGTPFEVEKGSDEEKSLEEQDAIRDAKESDIVRAREEGLEIVKRKPRFRTRREIRAVQDAERDLSDRGLSRKADEGGTAKTGDDPGTGHGSERSAVGSRTAQEVNKGRGRPLV